MIPHISRSGHMIDLLVHLVGPGRYDEQSNPRLIAGSPDITVLYADEEIDVENARRIARTLDQYGRFFDVAVMMPVMEWDENLHRKVKVGTKPAHVWHCTLSLHPDEGKLTDDKWAYVTADFVKQMGLDDGATLPYDFEAPDSYWDMTGPASCRWAAIRHGLSRNGNDHVHVVANLVRMDATKVSTWRDNWRSQQTVRRIELAHGLRVSESRNSKAAKASPEEVPAVNPHPRLESDDTR
ncbi:hypothetical protein GSU68_19570 (plasmid) [Rathayibacter sp. VKM Ac-2759]|uniref:relaxase/mobilization nuclease domain-containing protein n=1 Tax=Rathayibacter sp. VKM Ac-2759 TaxID=2609252 RepID=UPI0013162F23|nr:hypothetical protein [Rathayibacter sp. VKM Ac-2759]QHC68919.1 hypothetical protein GSU68_19570 [Rathayibacter sp. VKM Ac-2759]